jgi:O-antigen ligase
MVFDKAIANKKITIAALTVAVVALPFSVKICHGALLVLILNWIWVGQWKMKLQTVQQNVLLWPFLLFFMAHVIGLMYSDDLESGIFEIEKKAFFFLMPIILATSKIDLQNLKFVLKSFVLACLVALVVCAVMAFYRSTLPVENRPYNFDYYSTDAFRLQNPESSPSWHFFSYQEFASGINIHPTYFSLYILFSILVILYLAKDFNFSDWFSKAQIVVLIAVLSLGLLFLASRIIIICYFLLAIVSVIYFSRKSNSKAVSSISIVVMLISFSVLLLQPIARFRTFQEIQNVSVKIKPGTTYTQSISIRLSLWWLAFKSLQENNLIWGVGTGDAENVMRETSKKFQISNILNSYDPHNQFLQSTLSLGVVGLAILLSCLFLPMLCEPFAGNFLYGGFILIIFITCLTESLFELQKGIVFFSIFNSLFVFQLERTEIPLYKITHA